MKITRIKLSFSNAYLHGHVDHAGSTAALAKLLGITHHPQSTILMI